MLWRNQHVFDYRSFLLDQVSNCAEKDIAEGRFDDWRWRYDEREAVSYKYMLRQFWRPLDSFYPNKEFITPGPRN